MTQIKDYRISQDKFNEITNVLDKNGFNNLANEYRNIAKTAANEDGTISLGARDKKASLLLISSSPRSDLYGNTEHSLIHSLMTQLNQ